MKPEPIEQGNYYHIYNRGINGCNLFNEPENYLHFLRLYEKYIDPIAKTYAWCLMPNHFHLLVYIKKDEEIVKSSLSYSTVKTSKEIKASKQFSNLFNAYCLAFNKKYNRTGSLFEKPFERKKVDSLEYFKELVFYIHNNPVHHSFVERLQEYPWSSYGSVISFKSTKLERKEVIGYFDNVGNFIDFHKQKHQLKCIENLICE